MGRAVQKTFHVNASFDTLTWCSNQIKRQPVFEPPHVNIPIKLA